MSLWKGLRARLRPAIVEADPPPPLPPIPPEDEILLARIECNGFDNPCDYQMAISEYLGFTHNPVCALTAREGVRTGERPYIVPPGKVLMRKHRSLSPQERQAVAMAEVLGLRLPKKLKKRAEGKTFTYVSRTKVPPCGVELSGVRQEKRISRGFGPVREYTERGSS